MRQKLNLPNDSQILEWNDKIDKSFLNKTTDTFERIGILNRSAKSVFGVHCSSKEKIQLRLMPRLDLLQRLQSLASSANNPKNREWVMEQFSLILNKVPASLKKNVIIPETPNDILGCLRKFLETVTYDALLEGTKATTSSGVANGLKKLMFFNSDAHFRLMWKSVQRKQSGSRACITAVQVNGIIITDPEKVKKETSMYINGLLGTSRKDFSPNLLQRLKDQWPKGKKLTESEKTLLLMPFTVAEVIEAEGRSKAAAGLNLITNQHLKMLDSRSQKHLCELYTDFLKVLGSSDLVLNDQQKQHLRDWCRTDLFPIPKRAEDIGLHELILWRFIALSNSDCKAFNTMLINRLKKLIWKLIDADQYGYRKRSSCGMAVLRVQELLALGAAFMLKIDIRKAFDTVSWGMLWAVLRLFNIPEEYIQLWKKLWEYSSYTVRTAFGPTEPIHQKCGVKQGSIEAPLLFVLFVEAVKVLVVFIIGREIVMFVDDLTLIVRGGPHTNWKEVVAKVTEIFAAFELDIHAGKTEMWHTSYMAHDNRVIMGQRRGLHLLGMHTAGHPVTLDGKYAKCLQAIYFFRSSLTSVHFFTRAVTATVGSVLTYISYAADPNYKKEENILNVVRTEVARKYALPLSTHYHTIMGPHPIGLDVRVHWIDSLYASIKMFLQSLTFHHDPTSLLSDRTLKANSLCPCLWSPYSYEKNEEAFHPFLHRVITGMKFQDLFLVSGKHSCSGKGPLIVNLPNREPKYGVTVINGNEVPYVNLPQQLKKPVNRAGFHHLADFLEASANEGTILANEIEAFCASFRGWLNKGEVYAFQIRTGDAYTSVKPSNCLSVMTTSCVVYPTYKKKVLLNKVFTCSDLHWTQKFPCKRDYRENTCPHKAWLTAISPLNIGKVWGDLKCNCYGAEGGNGEIVWDIEPGSLPVMDESFDSKALIVVTRDTSILNWAVALGLREICTSNWSRVRLMSLKGVGTFTTKATVKVRVWVNGHAWSNLQSSFAHWALEKPTELIRAPPFKEIQVPVVDFWDVCANKARKINDKVFLIMDISEMVIITGVHVWASDGGIASEGKSIQINGASVCIYPGGVEVVHQVRKSAQRGEYVGMAQTLMSASGVCPRVIKTDSTNVEWATIFDDKPEWSTPLGPEEKLLRKALAMVTQPTLIIRASSHCIDPDLFQADRAAGKQTELIAERGKWPVTEGAVFSMAGDTLDLGFKNFSRASRFETWLCVKKATGVAQPTQS
eukprot:gene19398-960_t